MAEGNTNELLGEEYLEHARKVTTDVKEVQKGKLKEILSYNAGCQYLSSLGVDGETDAESFRKKVPVSCYEDLEENINRLANGEISNLYSVDPVDSFILSSGTSGGKAKLLPMTRRRMDKTYVLQKLSFNLMESCFPGMSKGKGLLLAFVGQQIVTPSGVIAGHGSTNFFKSDAWKKRPFDPTNVLASPDAAILCEDYHQAMYCHLLCGLYNAAEVSRILSIFASAVVTALRILQTCWKEICQDLREGTVSPRITDVELRKAMLEVISPNPDCALAVERECGQESWEGIVPRLWPNVALIHTVTTGSMEQYVPALQFFAGKIPLASPGYASAESNVLGLNLDPLRPPLETTYVLWPECQYFELIPLRKAGGDEGGVEETIELADAVVGEEYEPVLTTITGLYRYRLGDVVKVTGFYNATPEVKFVRRRNVLLSIHNDKTNERDLQTAVSKASELLRAEEVDVVDFTSATEVASHPGHYVVFFELTRSQQPVDASVLQECATALDRELDNEIYRENRKSKIIGPLELRILEEGSFERLMFLAFGRGAAPQQYKTPRCVKYDQGLQLLNGRVTSKFFSLAEL